MPKKKTKTVRKKAKAPVHEAWFGLLQAIGIVAYVCLVVLFFWYGERIFATTGNIFINQLVLLLLFVFSAFASGMIVLAYPGYTAFRGDYKRGLRMVGWTIGFLFALFIFVVAIAAYLQ